MSLTVIDVDSGRPQDIVVDADSASKVGDVAAAIGAALRRADAESVEAMARVVPLSRERTPPEPVVRPTGDGRLWIGGRSLDPELKLRETPLRDGAIVTLGAPGAGEAAEPSGAAELRIVGGPAAGSVHRLGLGERTVGFAPIGGVAIADPALADEQFRVVVAPAGVHVAPMPGRTLLREGQPVPEQGVHWQPGELLEAGNTLIGLGIPARPDAAVRTSDDGGLVFVRPRRGQSDAQVPRLELPVNRSGGKRDKKAQAEYADALARFSNDLWMAAQYDAVARRRECPDPAELLLTALGPRRRLWERRWRDVDALRLRLGVRTLPSLIDLVGPGADQVRPPPAWSVPVTVALRKLGVLGVAGPAARRMALARWLLIQAAVLHSPRELSIVVFGADGWEWVRWLPHLRPRHGQDAVVLVGNDPESAATRVTEITALIAARIAAARGDAPDKPPDGSESNLSPMLVVLDGARPQRQIAGMQAVLSRGPDVGVFAICLDEEDHLLPEECRAVVGFSREDPARLHLASTGAEERRDVLADQVSPAYARQVARALAPLRDGGEESQPTLPAVRLLELLDLDPPTREQIAEGWRLVGRSTTAVLGTGPDGTFAVDLQRHGPHCSVVGVIGSGKSELLQTLIASLAIANRPDALAVLLIDPGQNAAFADCAELPHTVVRLTDFDPHTAARTLEALTAEVRRRERLFAVAQAASIDLYLAGDDAGGRNLPRLVIVIDDLALLVRDVPDFVAGLVDIARRSQGLGIHLVVASADPDDAGFAGIVKESNLHIALRMADESQSHVVIGAPVAGRIAASAPGHGYARLGLSMLVPFQAARVAGRPLASAASVAVALVPWAAAGKTPPLIRAAAGIDADRPTDFAELVAAVRDTAEIHRILAPVNLWLPPLPDAVDVDSLASEQGPADPGRVAPVAYALADLPAEQRHQTVYFDLERDSHLMVIGARRSGRSTLLRTIADGIGAGATSEDVQLYIIDGGTDALRPLADLPHCVSLLTEKDADALERQLGLLAELVKQRRRSLADGGYADIAAQRAQVAAEARLPYLVVVLDCWEDFLEEYEDNDEHRLITAVYELLAGGAAVGLKFVLSADRSGLVGKLSSMVADRILLRLDDAADYQLAGAERHRLPAVIPPGRGLHTRDGVEIQVARRTADPRVAAPDVNVQRLEQPPLPLVQDVPAPQQPPRLETLPDRLTAAEADALDTATPEPATALVGVGGSGDAIGPRSLNLIVDGPGLLVAGPARSGRSTTLATILRSLLARGRHAVVLSPRISPLRDYAGLPGVAAVFDGLAAAEDLQAAWEATASPKVLVVDDLELIGPGSRMNQALDQLLVTAAESGDGIVAAGTTEELAAMSEGFGVAIRASRSGVLLAPAAGAGGELFGSPAIALDDASSSPGRGLLMRAGAAEVVQVAIAE